MYREAGNAETRGDGLLAEQRILTNCGPQLLGYLDRLRSVGFGHEYNKLVSTVAGHHIRAPAVLFQNLAYAVQYQIALEMPIEIVYELETVQIN